MTVHVTGRGVVVPAPLRRRIEAKVGKVGRLLPRATEARVVLSLERHRHRVAITLQGRGRILHAEAAAVDFLAGLDGALEGLAEQARRQKERRLPGKARPARRLARTTAAPADDLPVADLSAGDEAGPSLVVRRVGAKPMSLEEALDQMRLAGRDWLVFRNARSRVVNVLRRLPDGIVELVEPGA